MSIGSSVVKNIAQMNEVRYKFSAVYLNSSIYVFGGRKDGLLLSSCERYNIATNKW